MSAQSKSVKFKAACDGVYSRLKYSDNYVSNSYWLAPRKLFGNAQLTNPAAFVAALGAKPGECKVEKLPDEKMMFGRVQVNGRREYIRTPLHWENGAGVDHDAVCFLAEDGARLWLRLGYVRVFGIECVSGHGPQDPCAVVIEDMDVLVLTPCVPPHDQQALRVLLAVADGKSVVALPEVVAEKTREKKVSRSRRVEEARPDPRTVAAEAVQENSLSGWVAVIAGSQPVRDPSPSGHCEALGCYDVKVVGKLWCKRHSAPGGDAKDFI